ncbi:MAG: hypothetical protein JKY45_07550 [Emcibacter sp.]|nr:hypothetical protein [Emcibacter sp.]
MAFPTGWARKCKITIPDAQISGSNVNFPVLITQDNLPAEMLDGGVNSALNGGGDVVVTSDSAGISRLDLDVVEFVTGGVPVVEIYLKLPTLNTGGDREFWVWYQKSGETQPAVSATFGGNGVWSEAETALVMESSNPIDRTGNHVFNLNGSLTNISGPFGRANIFSGSDRLWNADPSLRDILLTYNTTVSVVSRNNNFAASEAVLSWEGADDFNLYPMSNSAPLVDGVRVFWRYVVNNNTFEASNISPADTWAWTSVTTRASNNHEMYQNGVSEATDTNSGTAGPFTAFYIGGFGVTSQSWNGDISQVIVWKTARSSDWTNTAYRNQFNPAAFASAGTPEVVTGGGEPTLSLQSSLHSVISGLVACSQAHDVTVNMTAHPLMSNNVTLQQGSNLTVNNSYHGGASDQISLTQNQIISINDAVHGQSTDGVSLSQGQLFVINDILHGVSDDTILLSQIQNLVVENATHGLMSDISGLFDPDAFTPNPNRTLTVERGSRNLSPKSGDRTTEPSNNRTLRI